MKVSLSEIWHLTNLKRTQKSARITYARFISLQEAYLVYGALVAFSREFRLALDFVRTSLTTASGGSEHDPLCFCLYSSKKKRVGPMCLVFVGCHTMVQCLRSWADLRATGSITY